MRNHDIVIIGSSAGGVYALRKLVKSFSPGIRAAIFVVQHVAADTSSFLPHILSREGKLSAVHPADGEPVKPGNIYVAPPDHHMIISAGKILVQKGPKENLFRPSIDALMRSAAHEYGPRVIGVVLTGMLDDGTSGLWSIKRLGGVSIIQTPEDAMFPDMPLNVLQYVDVDYNVPLDDLGSLINRLIDEPVVINKSLSEEMLDRMELKAKIADRENAFKNEVMEIGKTTSLTCPECGGAMLSFEEGSVVRYRCHTGHAYTSDFLIKELTELIEAKLWQCLRSMEEVIMLLDQSVSQSEKAGREADASEFSKKSKKLRDRASELLDFIYHKGQPDLNEL